LLYISGVSLIGGSRKLKPTDIPQSTIKSLQKKVHKLHGSIPFSVYSIDGFEVEGMVYRSGEFVLLEAANIVQITTIYCCNTEKGAKIFFVGRALIENGDGTRVIPDLITRGDKKVAQCMPCDHSLLFDTSLIVDKALCFHSCMFRHELVSYDAPPSFPCCKLATKTLSNGSKKTVIDCTRRNPFYFIHNLTRKYRLLYLRKADNIPHYRLE